MGVLLAHGFGQDALQRRLRRAAVVFADPACELENLGRDERLRADDFEDGLEVRVRRLLGERGDDAENLARAERHLHAAAHIHRVGEFWRDGVIELLAERDFE